MSVARKTSHPKNGGRAYAKADLANQKYLFLIGSRIRTLRSRRGLTRKMLAAQSGVSERFLAELEIGKGNASVLLLRHLAQALDVPFGSLVFEGGEPTAELTQTTEFLRSLSPDELSQARQWLTQNYGRVDRADRIGRVALIGLRGAGKSTIGAPLARKMNVPFFELDRLIEKASGVPMGSIFDLYGQSGFRRFERSCLEDLLTRQAQFVLATSGGIVSEADTFNRLLTSCYTVWLRSTPEDHMKRVIAQGDMRPMAQSSQAMSDLKRILSEREPFYAKADLVIDTSDATVPSAVVKISNRIQEEKASAKP